jgi:hypothetical protein
MERPQRIVVPLIDLHCADGPAWLDGRKAESKQPANRRRFHKNFRAFWKYSIRPAPPGS